MNPHLQEALITLLGAMALGVPLTARAIPRAIDQWTKAKADAKRAQSDALRTSAETEKLEAETAAAALLDLRRRLDDCEAKHKISDQKHLEQQAEINGLQQRAILDQNLLEQFQAKMEADEAARARDEGLIRGMKVELDELRRIVSTGGRHA